MEIKDGIKRTFGNTKACEVFVDLMEDGSIPKNHKNYIYNQVKQFYDVSLKLYKTSHELKFRRYIGKLVITDYIKRADKYLTGKHFTFFENILKTRLKLLDRKYPLESNG
jgi:hypothetical protein